MDKISLKSHKKWIIEIYKYKPNLSYEEIIKFSLSYTLQSLRNDEDMNRFKWEEIKELENGNSYTKTKETK